MQLLKKPSFRNYHINISNEEIRVLKKIVKSLEESGLLVKRINETIKNETKEQEWGLLLMLLGTLAASLLGISSTGKREISSAEEVIRAGENFWFHSIL